MRASTREGVPMRQLQVVLANGGAAVCRCAADRHTRLQWDTKLVDIIFQRAGKRLKP